MSQVLAIDVGAGTQDILLYDSQKTIENCVKLVLPSQTTRLARRVAVATEAGADVFLTGNLMGGGPLASAVKKHLRAGFSVYATPLAAKSLRDDPREVEALGVKIVSAPPSGTVTLKTGDVDLEALRQALAHFDVGVPDRYVIAVQDHGECTGISQRRFRFQHWEQFVRGGGSLPALAHTSELPDYLTRMKAVRQDAPGALMMDTCAAAVLGALCDERVAAYRDEGLVIVNIGNQHTLGVLCQGNRILGLFEHHTVLMTEEKLARYIRALQLGTIDNEQVYEDNGHGAIVHPDFSKVNTAFETALDSPGGKQRRAFDFVAITGPNRRLAQSLGYYCASPHGDMMLSGCFGLITAAQWAGWVS